MQDIENQIQRLLRRRIKSRPDKYAHVQPKTKSIFKKEPQEDRFVQSLSMTDQEKHRKRQQGFKQYQALDKRLNKRFNQNFIYFREQTNPKLVIDFPSKPYQLPVQPQPYVKLEQYVPPPPKVIPPPKVRMRVADWVYGTFKFKEIKKPVPEKEISKSPVQKKPRSIMKLASLFATSFKDNSSHTLLRNHPFTTAAQKNIAARFRSNIKIVIQNLHQIKMSITDLITKKPINRQPFGRPGSFQFFKAVKQSDKQTIISMLQKCQFYVYDRDKFGMRPLHWAAKNGNMQVVQLILGKKPLLNQKDRAGRTAISLAIKQNLKQVVLRLFIEGAKLQIQEKIEQRTDYYMVYMLDKLQEIKKKSEKQKYSQEKLKEVVQQTFSVEF